ncbi:MAG: hypothetical protein LBV58_03120 [Acholeplasmatales bacterium]|nr:hypothetical protein [Acholeplasmatales bacterium]
MITVIQTKEPSYLILFAKNICLIFFLVTSLISNIIASEYDNIFLDRSLIYFVILVGLATSGVIILFYFEFILFKNNKLTPLDTSHK